MKKKTICVGDTVHIPLYVVKIRSSEEYGGEIVIVGGGSGSSRMSGKNELVSEHVFNHVFIFIIGNSQ
jgi:hypothetical protein